MPRKGKVEIIGVEIAAVTQTGTDERGKPEYGLAGQHDKIDHYDVDVSREGRDGPELHEEFQYATEQEAVLAAKQLAAKYGCTWDWVN